MRGGWWVPLMAAAACGGPLEVDQGSTAPASPAADEPVQGRCIHGEDDIVSADLWLEPFGASAGDALLPAVGDFAGTLEAAGLAVPLRLSFDIGQAEVHLQDAWWEGPWPAGDPVACAPTLRVAVAAVVDADSWLQTQFVGELVVLPDASMLATEVPGASVAGEGVGGESEVALAVSAVLDRDGSSGAFARPEGALEPEVLADFWTRRLDDGP